MTDGAVFENSKKITMHMHITIYTHTNRERERERERERDDFGNKTKIIK
jgi:hypothetical protein